MIRRCISYCKIARSYLFLSLIVVNMILRVMFCSIVNLAASPGASFINDVFVTQFFYIAGGTEMLSLPGCYMLIHLKEAAVVIDEGSTSFKISSNISIPEFRTYSGFETLYWSRMTNNLEDDRAHSTIQAA